MNIVELKTVSEVGILIVIAVTFIQQQRKLFSQYEKQITILTKLEKTIDGGFLSVENLDLIINLKQRDIINDLRRKIVNYIRNNNLKHNWDNIHDELSNYISKKIKEFDYDIKSKVEDNIYLQKKIKQIKMTLHLTINDTMLLVYKEIEELKNMENPVLPNYVATERRVNIKFDELENRLNENY